MIGGMKTLLTKPNITDRAVKCVTISIYCETLLRDFSDNTGYIKFYCDQAKGEKRRSWRRQHARAQRNQDGVEGVQRIYHFLASTAESSIHFPLAHICLSTSDEYAIGICCATNLLTKPAGAYTSECKLNQTIGLGTLTFSKH